MVSTKKAGQTKGRGVKGPYSTAIVESWVYKNAGKSFHVALILLAVQSSTSNSSTYAHASYTFRARCIVLQRYRYLPYGRFFFFLMRTVQYVSKKKCP